METVCPHCQGTGFEEVDLKTGKNPAVKRCRCWADKKRAFLLKHALIPQRYQGCRLDNFNIYGVAGRKNINRSLSMSFSYGESFIKKYPQVEKGFFFMGPAGSGKTHLAVAIMQELILTKGVSALFCDFQEFLFGLKASFDDNAESSQSEVLNPILNAELLLLDDLGAVKVTAWRRDMLSHIITSRYNSNKPTFFTSSYLDRPGKLEDSLEERIGSRLRSRISEMCLICQLDSPDYRRADELKRESPRQDMKRSLKNKSDFF